MEEITIIKARKVLEEEKKERIARCKVELDSLLETHNCQLQVQLGIVEGKIVSNIVLTER